MNIQDEIIVWFGEHEYNEPEIVITDDDINGVSGTIYVTERPVIGGCPDETYFEVVSVEFIGEYNGELINFSW